LTKYRVAGQDPLIQLTDNRYRIGFSNHADFDQTIEYIRSTGARLVVTDCVRASKGREGENNYAVQLADSVRCIGRINHISAESAKYSCLP
jgi:hypothetical protein